MQFAEAVQLSPQTGAIGVAQGPEPLVAIFGRCDRLEADHASWQVGRLALRLSQFVAQLAIDRLEERRVFELCVDVEVVDHRQIGDQHAVGVLTRQLKHEEAERHRRGGGQERRQPAPAPNAGHGDG
jgi:hypothetical protein